MAFEKIDEDTLKETNTASSTYNKNDLLKQKANYESMLARVNLLLAEFEK